MGDIESVFRIICGGLLLLKCRPSPCFPALPQSEIKMNARCKWLFVSLVLVALQYAKSLSIPNRAISKQRVVVIGKIIIDDYRKELESPSDGRLSIGGGGPQAAFGAAAALAVLDNDSKDDPLPQPVTFLGPVGKLDWSERENNALHELLDPMVDSLQVLEGPAYRTPRIQLWHDSDQNVQWMPLNDSFGPEGAGGLWRNRPSAADVLKCLREEETLSTLHLIIEVGADSPGAGQDSMLLRDGSLTEKAKVIGIEPIAFPDAATGNMSERDSESCSSRLDGISTVFDVISPDMHLYRAFDKTYWRKWDVAVRDGPRGSFIRERGSETKSLIPAAELHTCDGSPVNPTGAGNAYSAAMTTCIGAGVPLVDAGCIASAIGAVVCEHEHLPPWNADTMKRIRQAATEVKEKRGIHSEIRA